MQGISSMSVFGAPASQAAAPATPPTPTSATGSGTITSSDFLTLLVTEMKNQDPTAPSDPTQYVQQLVQVNSLQQLIDINQKTATLPKSVATPAA